VRDGDYVEAQLAEVMDRPRLVGDIVTHRHRLAEGRKTVVFATGVQHSIYIRDEFIKSVSAEHIDGATPKEERDDILRMLATGAIDVVSNRIVLTEGWDMPDVGCCVLARPTRKMGLYRQMIGRVLRAASVVNSSSFATTANNANSPSGARPTGRVAKPYGHIKTGIDWNCSCH
jgi:DNA repair protein RadD